MMLGMFFIYSVKVAVCLALFYLFHKLLMSRDTFHTFNRFAILSMMLLSLVLPFVHLSLDSETGINRGTVALEGLVAQTVVDGGGNGVGEGMTLTQVLLATYVLGVVLFVGKALLSVGSLLRLIRRARCVEVRNGIRIYTMQGDISPFSWFRYIIMSEKDWQENRREIVLHEMAHIRRCHSMDVAVCNMMIVFQWYNPAAWLLKRELQTVHEYEADEAVLSAGVDATHYQMLLIRTNPVQKAKIAFVLPLAAMTVAAFASQKVENLSEKVEQESEAFSSVSDNPVVRAVGETARVAAVKVQEDKALEEVSSMAMAKDTAETKSGKEFPCIPETFPQFPGGHVALFEYLSKNIKFPKSKENEDVKVRVVTTFTVEKDGSITDAKIVRSQGEAFDNEALRVINGMPKWIPGMQNGKAVSVKYTLPITFSTTDSDKKIKSVRTIDMNDNGGKQPEGKVVSRKVEMFSSEDFVLVVNGKVVEALNGIKPSDIEKVDVKKDAETMKKYNAEGKQGVMLISTK